MAKKQRQPEQDSGQKLRSRIQRLQMIRAAEIEGAPFNWRMHPQQQIDAITGSIEELGFIDPLDVREVGEGRYQLWDGHARRDLICSRIGPETLIPCIVTDLTEEEAKKANLLKDPLAAMATADAAKLDALLREVQTGSEGVAAMLTELAQQNDIISGVQSAELPGLPSGDKEPFQQMTFTLHDTQAEVVKRAIDKAKADGFGADVNENSNGNALAAIAEVYLGER